MRNYGDPFIYEILFYLLITFIYTYYLSKTMHYLCVIMGILLYMKYYFIYSYTFIYTYYLSKTMHYLCVIMGIRLYMKYYFIYSLLLYIHIIYLKLCIIYA